MKRLIAGIMAICLCGCFMQTGNKYLPEASPLSAYAESSDPETGSFGPLTYGKYQDSILIYYCVDMEEVEIPSEIEGLPVKSIAPYAFSSCKSLKKVVIPESIVSIGFNAFENTPWLEDMRKKSPAVVVNDILIDAQKCSGDVVVPDGVKTIGNAAFNCANELTSVKLPNSVTKIENGAFYACTSLKSIELPDSVTDLGESVFVCCRSLESVTLPKNITEIKLYTFAVCTKLKKVTLPYSVEKVGDHAFSECWELKEIIVTNPDCEICDENGTITNVSEEFILPDPPPYDEVGYYGIIYGKNDSKAQAYAQKYGYNFKALPDLGDTDLDGTVDSSDASLVLAEYAVSSTGRETILTELQKFAADTNRDETIDASDASQILMFYAYTSTGGTETDMEKWLK